MLWPRLQNHWLVMMHLLGCALFLSIPVFDTHPGPGLQYINEILEYAFTIGTFYLAYFLLIPRYFFRKKYGVFILCTLAGFALVNFLPELLTSIVYSEKALSGNQFPPPLPNFGSEPSRGGILDFGPFGPLGDNLLKYGFALILAITLKLSEQYRKSEQAKDEAEIRFLRAQINPHFLFNTLNSIYSLSVAAGAEEASQAIIRLSGMMRYATGEAHMGQLGLEAELQYLESYIQLQQLRLNAKTTVDYDRTGDASGKVIAPFLMIPFVENAFKYGVSTDLPSTIVVRIQITDDCLLFHARNSKVLVQPESFSGTSTGLSNTRQRLKLLYPSRHQLQVTEQASFFDVQLSISL